MSCDKLSTLYAWSSLTWQTYTMARLTSSTGAMRSIMPVIRSCPGRAAAACGPAGAQRHAPVLAIHAGGDRAHAAGETGPTLEHRGRILYSHECRHAVCGDESLAWSGGSQMRRLFPHVLHDRFCAIPIAKPTTMEPAEISRREPAGGTARGAGLECLWSGGDYHGQCADGYRRGYAARQRARCARRWPRRGRVMRFSSVSPARSLLRQGALVVDKNVTITGPGASQSGD